MTIYQRELKFALTRRWVRALRCRSPLELLPRSEGVMGLWECVWLCDQSQNSRINTGETRWLPALRIPWPKGRRVRFPAPALSFQTT